MAEEILFRALEPADLDKLQDGFYSHSERTIRKRYGTDKHAMSYCEANQKTLVDHTVDGALGAFANNGRDLIGVGRLYDDGDGKGEIALVVDDEYQRRGIGTYMCEQLCMLASIQGKNLVYGEVDYGNLEVSHIFQNAGFDKEPSSQLEGWRYIKEVKPSSLSGKESTNHYSFNKAQQELNGDEKSVEYSSNDDSTKESSPLTQLFFAPLDILETTAEIATDQVRKIGRWQGDIADKIMSTTNTVLKGPNASRNGHRR